MDMIMRDGTRHVGQRKTGVLSALSVGVDVVSLLFAPLALATFRHSAQPSFFMGFDWILDILCFYVID